jgi:prepilin-type N-terminal cleavage/methylation domain-containing protein
MEMRIQNRAGEAQAGFSLIELLIAMVLTLITCGAIFGLMTASQGTFRREPRISEQQQNLRAGMDLLVRDISNAGVGMPAFMQTFTTGLDGATSGAGVSVVNPLPGDLGTITDEIEMMTDDSGRGNLPVCGNPGGSHVLTLYANTSYVQDGDLVTVIVRDPPTTGDLYWVMRQVTGISYPNTGAGDCKTSTGKHQQFGTNPGGTSVNPSGSICANGEDASKNPTLGSYPLSLGGTLGNNNCDVLYIAASSLIRWRVAAGADGAPELQRRRNSENWVTVARNIENLQVQYFRITDTPTPNAGLDNSPAITMNDYTTLVTQVRVSLTARSEGLNVVGETSKVTGAVRRSRLDSLVAVRSNLVAAANVTVTTGGPTPLWQ